MSNRATNSHRYLSNPWVAAAAMTLGFSAIALGAYTVEDPNAFTHARRLEPAQDRSVKINGRVESSATTDLTSPLVLDEVRIVGRAQTTADKTATTSEDCQQEWRSMASGPAARTVRGFCPAPSNAIPHATARGAATRTSAGLQRATAPRAAHERINSVQTPEHSNSLSDLIPPV